MRAGKWRRFLSVVVLFGTALAWSGCTSTPDRRIAQAREFFNALPVEAQEKIARGEVDVGFTERMVYLALGEPDRTYLRRTESGDGVVWAYRENRPAIGFSLGVGTFGGGLGGGVGVATGVDREDDAVRVIFRNGEVDAVERRES